MSEHNKAENAIEAVTVSLHDLEQSSLPFNTLENAFGPSSLGILIVNGLPSRFNELRHKVLSYASYLANLPSNELGISLLSCVYNHDELTCPSSRYLSGWSHGKEALKNGTYDTFKGSYYVNCSFYQGPGVVVTPSADFPEFTAPNIWPAESSLPGFQAIFEELCNLIIDTAVLVARACDRYASAHIMDYEQEYLEHVVKTSKVTKARLLHYFPPEISATDITDSTLQKSPSEPTSTNYDSWCATHIDHGCLTGLTSALYIDEAAHEPHIPQPVSSNPSSILPALPALDAPPDPSTGLYIHARDSTIAKISIPSDCLAFQTGEALQVITRGRFRAVPHFVRAGGTAMVGQKVSRNTLAVFTQPGLEELVDRECGLTFGAFSREVVSRFG